MNEDEAALADKVRDARKARVPRYTQRMLAADAGVSLGVVSNFERKVTFPQPGNLEAILRALGIEEHAPRENGDGETGDVDELPICDKCRQITWPENYALMFDILGAFMDTIPTEERKAFQRWITQPMWKKRRAGEKLYRPWLHD